MKLPNSSQAYIDRRKLVDYCLNPDHHQGQHKAKVFKAALGLIATDADELETMIRTAVVKESCVNLGSNLNGSLFRIDFVWRRKGRIAKVRTGWIVRHGEDFPRLTTCYIL